MVNATIRRSSPAGPTNNMREWYRHVESYINRLRGWVGAVTVKSTYSLSLCLSLTHTFIHLRILLSPTSPSSADYDATRISTDLIRGLMEGNAYPVLGNGGVQLEGKALQTFQKSFVQVENILDQNRVLINEINQNQESKIPDNLSRNVGLIRELNNNIRKVVNLYSDLSSNFSKSMDVEGDSRLDAKALLKRNKPA
ncbi:hypothetical protein R6Q59_016546 [Mikania micrantha]